MGTYELIRDELIAGLIGMGLRVVAFGVEKAAEKFSRWTKERIERRSFKTSQDDERDG